MKQTFRACRLKPSLKNRPLLETGQAGEVAAIFRVLANDTRLRIIHALVRSGEMPVSALAQTVGVKTQAVSNQLQRMAAQGILANRREGNSIYYRVADPCAVALLERGLCLLEDAKTVKRQRALKANRET